MIGNGTSRAKATFPFFQPLSRASRGHIEKHMDLLPTAFLFRFALPIPYAPDLPRAIGPPIGDPISTIPLFSTLDRPGEEIDLGLVWNEDGIGVSLEVHGKKKPPFARAADHIGDGLTIWIDTRDARGAHRAGRFCHQFVLLPNVSKSKTYRAKLAKKDIVMAREYSAPLFEPPHLHSKPLDDGYRMETWLPAAQLHGFDPELAPKIGFHAIINDRELGERPLTVGTEFATDRDPSLWTTLALSRETPAAPPAKKNRTRSAGKSTKKTPTRKKTSRKKTTRKKKT